MADPDNTMNDPTLWPPGTIQLEVLNTRTVEDSIILEPQPTDDPNDPLNWPKWYKNLNFSMVVLYSFLVFSFVCMYTPLWNTLNDELGISFTDLNNSLAVNNASLAVGAFFFIPFVLKFGRRPVYLFSTLVQMGFCIWYANINNAAGLYAVNILSCLLGAVAEVIIQMTVADIYFVHERGLANTVFSWAFNAGGNVMPTVAGQITLTAGWRWVWLIMAIIFGACVPLFFFFYEETKYAYPIEIIDGRTMDHTQTPVANLDQKFPITSNFCDNKQPDSRMSVLGEQDSLGPGQDSMNAMRHNIAINSNLKRTPYWRRLKIARMTPGSIGVFLRHVWHPIEILFTIPAVFFVALLWGITLAWMQVLLSTISIYMPQPPYNFNPAQVGMMSLSALVGYTVGSVACGLFADRLVLWLARRNNGIYEPEMRLWVMVPFIPLIPAGAIMYGVALAYRAHWLLLAGGAALINVGVAPLNSISLTYLTDSYTEIIGEALISITLPRYGLGTVFVFATSPWIAAMGFIKTFIIIDIIGTCFLMLTFVFIKYGKRFRVQSAARYRRLAAKQFKSRAV